MKRSHAWHHHGTVSLWRYLDNLRNYPGWHIGADAAGCASMLALLDALALDGPAATRTLQLSSPSPAQRSWPCRTTAMRGGTPRQRYG